MGDCHRHPTVPTDPVDTLSPMPTITVIIDDRHEGTRLKITMPRSLVEDLLAHGEERWEQGEEGVRLDSSARFDATDNLARVEIELTDE